MNFGSPNALWGSLLLLVVIGAGWWRVASRQKKLRSALDQELIAKLLPAGAVSSRAGIFRAVGISLSIMFIVIALLRPRFGFTWIETKRLGLDLMIAVDVSESMLARDLSPSRLDRARHEVFDPIQHLHGERIGLVAFAGVSFLETPLTYDYSTVALFLNNLRPELVPVQGTNIESAVIRALEGLSPNRPNGDLEEGKSERAKSTRPRAIILLTDGEDFEGDTARVRDALKESGTRLYIIGVGTVEGAPIPSDGGYKKDREGNIVMTRLNEDRLRTLAQESGGIYVPSLGSDLDTTALYDRGIRRELESEFQESGRFKQWNEIFQLPLLIGMLLWIGTLYRRGV